MLRIAIVGYGKIADQHLQASKIVTVRDWELLMAKQLGERFGHFGMLFRSDRNAAGRLSRCRSHCQVATEYLRVQHSSTPSLQALLLP